MQVHKDSYFTSQHIDKHRYVAYRQTIFVDKYCFINMQHIDFIIMFYL